MKKTTSYFKNALFIFGFLFALTANAQRQQIGTDLFGVPMNHFGGSVALSADGTIMVVGSSGADNNGPNSGEVNVFTYNGAEWVERGESIKGADGDALGIGIAMTPDGSRIIVGSYSADTSNGNNSGKVEVFDWDGNNWVAVGNTINGLFNTLFGFVVSIADDGNRIAISAPNFGANYQGYGQVKMYELNGTTWQQMGAEITGEASFDFLGFGMQLSADGSRIAIGSEQNDNAADNAGNIKVYQWNGTSWEEMGTQIGGDAAGSFFGKSLSFSADGNRVAGGAPSYDERRGYTKVLDWNGTSWVQIGQIIYGENMADETGESVALSADGSTLSVGAYLNPGGGYRRGQVRVYKLNGNTWQQVDAPINGLIDSELIGAKTALSGNGEFVVAASTQSNLHGDYAGVVRVYQSGVLNTEDFSALNKVTVFPVPAKESVTIALGKTYAEVSIIQYDILGKEINRIHAKNETTVEFPLKGGVGIYFIKIATENNSKTIKIVKE